jgi:hypothetical protein
MKTARPTMHSTLPEKTAFAGMLLSFSNFENEIENKKNLGVVYLISVLDCR